MFTPTTKKAESDSIVAAYNKLQIEINKVDKVIREELAGQDKAIEELGVPLTEDDKKRTEVYRYGKCGDACDILKNTALKNKELKDYDFENLKKCSKEDGGHYYLYDKESNIVVEPTYKQFLYRAIINRNNSGFKEGFSEEHEKIINDMPNIFVGSPQKLKEVFIEYLSKLSEKKLSEDLNYALNNYTFFQSNKISNKNENMMSTQELKKLHEATAPKLNEIDLSKKITNLNKEHKGKYVEKKIESSKNIAAQQWMKPAKLPDGAREIDRELNTLWVLLKDAYRKAINQETQIKLHKAILETEGSRNDLLNTNKCNKKLVEKAKITLKKEKQLLTTIESEQKSANKNNKPKFF